MQSKSNDSVFACYVVKMRSKARPSVDKPKS